MARSLLAELVIALRDGVSGPAKKLADSLKGVETAVDALNRKGGASKGLDQTASSLDKATASAKMLAAEGTKLADWGSAFQKQIAKMKLSAADLDKLRQSWRDLNRELAGTDKAFRSTAIANWKNEVRQWALGIDAAKRSMHGLGTSAAAARREMAQLSNLTRTLGMGGAAYALQSLLRSGGKAAAEYGRETQARQVMSGIKAEDRQSLQAKSMGLSFKYKSMDMTTINELGRSLYNMTGSMPKATDLLEDFARMYTVLQTIKGKDGAAAELNDMSKAIDIFGRQENPAEIRAILDAALKASQVEGRQLPLTEYLKMAKYSKAAGAALSPEFLGGVAPSFMQESGGQRFGTALGSTVSQMIGNRITKKARAEQQTAGIREGRNGDKVKDSDLLMSNPYDWAQKHLYPAMMKEGFDPRQSGNEDKVLGFMSKIFSNQMVSDVFTKFFTQYDQIERNKNQLYPAAMGMSAADMILQKDAFAALEGVLAQLRNLFAILGDAGALNTVIGGLNTFSDALVTLNSALSGSPIAANILSIAGALIGLRVALAAFRLGKSLLGLPAAMAGGAAAGAAGTAAAGAGGAAAGAGASRLAMLARGAGAVGRGLTWVPGLGWIALGAGVAAGLANGDGDVKPGDLSESEEIARNRGRRWYRPPAKNTTPDQAGVGNIGGSSMGRFGLGGFAPRIDVDSFTKADEAAKNTKASIEGLNGVTAKPHVDTAEIDNAQAKVDKLRASLQQIGSDAAAIGRRVEQSVRTAMRAGYNDYGSEESG